MQLRIPKQYRRSRRTYRRRRWLPSRRWILTWVGLIAIGYAGLWFVQNPETARVRADNFQKNVRNTFDQSRQELFPAQPTPTPNVEDDLISGDRAYSLGDMEQAIASYRIAIQGRPNDDALHYKLAHTLIITSAFGSDEARIREALEVAELTINANPESPLGWAIRAMALDWSGEHARALSSIQRALELDPNSLLVKAHLINIYRNTGNADLALSMSEDAIDAIETRSVGSEVIAQIYRNYARLLSSNYADYENAAKAYERAYQAMPNQSYIAIELAQTYNYLGENARALDLLEEVTENNPRDLLALSTLGNLYILSGDDRYLNVYSRCIAIDPDYVPCASPLGQLYFFAADYNAAIETLTRAVNSGSTNPYDYYLLARSYWNLGQCAQAAPHFNNGYQLIVENGDTQQVSASNFIDAMNICGLPIPQIQLTANEATE